MKVEANEPTFEPELLEGCPNENVFADEVDTGTAGASVVSDVVNDPPESKLFLPPALDGSDTFD